MEVCCYGDVAEDARTIALGYRQPLGLHMLAEPELPYQIGAVQHRVLSTTDMLITSPVGHPSGKNE